MLSFDADGTPFCNRYGDVYKSRAGAFAEARAVFVDGCRLGERWQAQPHFTVLELGFGLGVNTLATLAAWRAHPRRPRRLTIVSVEKHPLPATSLRQALEAVGAPAGDAAALLARWPCPLPGLHRIAFDGGAVQLLLAIGDALDVVPRLSLAADAFYLDGFAPSRNPALWSTPLLRALARHARVGATLATYTASHAVRRDLAGCGFDVAIVPGFGGKQRRIDATYAPRFRTWPEPAAAPVWPRRQVVVVGAGLAGDAVAAEFARRDWRVVQLGERGDPQAGSSQPVGAEHVHLSPDDNHVARLSRAALLMRQETARQETAPPGPPPAGRLVVAADAAEQARFAAMVDRLGFTDRFVRSVSAGEASDLAGLSLPRGGLWLPLCSAAPIAARPQAAADAIARRPGLADRVVRVDDGWRVLDGDGRCLADGAVVVFANAADALRLSGSRLIRLRHTAGQTTALAAPALRGLRVVLGGAAYAVPAGLCGAESESAVAGTLIGSTFRPGSDGIATTAGDISNCTRLAASLGLDLAELLPHASGRFGGRRCAPADHLPVIGTLLDEQAWRADAAAFRRNQRLALPLQPGLYALFGLGSRGLLWATLGARLLGAMADGEPLPIEGDLARALAPARFARAGRAPSGAGDGADHGGPGHDGPDHDLRDRDAPEDAPPATHPTDTRTT